MPGTILFLDNIIIGHENVQGCSETLQGLLTQEHLLGLMRKKDTDPQFPGGPWDSSHRISEVGAFLIWGLRRSLRLSCLKHGSYPRHPNKYSPRVFLCAQHHLPTCRQGLLETGGDAPHTPTSAWLQEQRGRGIPYTTPSPFLDWKGDYLTSSSCTNQFPL